MGQLFLNPGPIRAPWPLKVVTRIPRVQRVMGRVIGLGARPEHVREPQEQQPRFRPAKVAFAAVGIAVAAAATGWLVWKACRRCL
jgi:hypothetical protein